MTSIRRFPLAFVVSILLAASFSAIAAQQAAAPQTITGNVPTDKEIIMGKFDNGLRYYVRANAKPEKRAELRLVVRAGSILEEDDQQGLAHFVEHMAFNGTKNFPKDAIISFIESLGMRFGADLNAGTGFDETTYMLTVPTDKPEALEKSFLVLEDWAHNVSFDNAEIDKERGVIMEEWRQRRGAGARLNDKMFPILLQGSRYADRIPIGKTEILQNFKPERLKQFYADWYRPDLMAVIAVGDFDKTAVENMIKTHFSAIPKATAPRPRPNYEIPDHAGTYYAILTDKELTSVGVEVDNLLPSRQQGSVAVYRQEMVDRLFAGMLNARFSEITQKPNAPFLGAGVGRGSFFGRTKDDASLSANVKEDGVERGMEAMFAETERVTRFGFTATELDRQKQQVLRGYERSVVESANRVSASRAAEYARNFTNDEPLPSAQDEYALHQQLLPGITLDEINKLAREWFTDQNRLIIVTGPEKPGLTLPNEAKLVAAIKAGLSADLKPYVDTVASASLMESLPQPGRIIRTTVKESLGITEWELSNGAKVVLKPTTFREDEILFRASSPGGTSLVADKDMIPADTASMVVSAGGVGKFSVVDLRKVMTGKVAAVSTNIDELFEGMSGNSSKKDMEAMFQLIYLRFTQPRYDATVFEAQAEQLKTALANQTASPQFVFSDTLTKTLSQNHPRRYTPSPAMVEQLDLDKSMAIYKDRFADASDFTFLFVGSFDVAAIRPLVERYLASLPSIQRKETWKDLGIYPPKGVIDKTVEKGIEPASNSAIVFSGPFEYNLNNRVAIRGMSQILQMRLLKVIREELGGTYSISASSSFKKIPHPEYTVQIGFGSDPQRTEELIKRVYEEIEKFKKEGPSEKELSDEKEALLRDYESNSKLNGYYAAQLMTEYQIGEDPAVILQFPDYYRKLDAAAIQQAAKTFLNMDNRVRVSLFPEKK